MLHEAGQPYDPRMQFRILLAAAVAFAVGGCRKPADDPPTGFVQAKRIEVASDLIGGPRAEGRVGDFLLANDHVRVVIGAAEGSVGFNLFGGSLLDADVTRAPGEPGQDRFGEAFPSVNVLTIAAVDTVEVVDDGSNRRRASIRVAGPGYRFPLTAEIPGLTNPVDVDLETIYSLTPDASSVLIETYVTMNEPETTVVQAFDVLLVGNGLRSFGAPLGEAESGTFEWTGADTATDTAQGGGVAETAGIAYAWLPLEPEKTLDIPFADASQQLAVMGGLTIASGKRRAFRRRLVIAGPDLAAASKEIERVRGTKTGTFAGQVRDTVGQAVVGARIRIAEADDPERFVTRARSGTEGAFVADLPAGAYDAIVEAEHRGSGEPLRFEIRAGKTAQALFVMPAVGTVTFSATDGADGSPIPARLTLVKDGQVVARAYGNAGEARAVAVAPGSFTAYVSRGPEWSLGQAAISVPAGGNVAVPASASTLTRVVGTAGFVAGDYHLHTVQSRDSGVPLAERALSLAGEGLEHVAATDHDRATDYRPAIEALALEPFLSSLVGSEVSIVLYGHFNAYPMPDGSATSRAHDGTKVWFDAEEDRHLGAAELLAKLRALPGDRILQMNHPRSGAGKGYLAWIDYDPATGTADEPLATDFDTIEVNDEFEPVEGNAMLDWFSIRKMGIPMTAVGVSDSHVVWDPGYPRTLVEVGTDDPSQVETSSFVEALRAGRAVVSSGPFVLTTAGVGSERAGLGEMLDATGGGSVTVEVHVESPAWIPFDTIRLYENGTLVDTAEVNPPLAGGRFVHDESFPVAPLEDAFYVVVVTGPGNLYPISERGVFAYTNPVFVDVGTAGWEPPGL